MIMKYKSEVRIGITGIITLLVIIWGVNYLKGQNLIKSNYKLVAMYNQAEGLESSAGVLLNGFKIGTVSEVRYDTEKQVPVTVYMEVENRYKLPKGSIAQIFSADLLGSRAIKIISGNSEITLQNGDTLAGSIENDLFSTLLDEIDPLSDGITSAVNTLDSAASALNSLLRNPSVSMMINNMEEISSSLKKSVAESGDLGKALESIKNISGKLEDQLVSIENSIKNFESISGDMKDANLDSLILSMNQTATALASISGAIQKGEGTIGKLVYEDSIYNQINLLVTDLDSLINDITSNPKKYVHFSLIGR